MQQQQPESAQSDKYESVECSGVGQQQLQGEPQHMQQEPVQPHAHTAAFQVCKGVQYESVGSFESRAAAVQ